MASSRPALSRAKVSADPTSGGTTAQARITPRATAARTADRRIMPSREARQARRGPRPGGRGGHPGEPVRQVPFAEFRGEAGHGPSPVAFDQLAELAPSDPGAQ